MTHDDDTKPSGEVIVRECDHDFNIPGQPLFSDRIRMIEKSAYDTLKQAHEELLSYLPKVPTEPYEREMAQKILLLEHDNRAAESVCEFLRSEVDKLKRERDEAREMVREDLELLMKTALERDEAREESKAYKEKRDKLHYELGGLKHQLTAEKERSAKLALALERIAIKAAHQVSREEAADMACEFVIGAREALAAHDSGGGDDSK